MKPISIKGISIGECAPKTIISLMGATPQAAIEASRAAIEAGADCLEWRADFCDDVHDVAAMERDAAAVREALPDAPLLFTFRSISQGGQLELPVPEYVRLTAAMIRTDLFDLVDIESWIGDDEVRSLAALAREHGVAVIVSHHDFDGTPSKDWMVQEMRHMQDLGADIPKIAVMAKSAADTLALLAATEEMARLYAAGPLLTMAMGRWGSLSRLTGEVFGSSMTFCAVQKASAPGQVELKRARSLMDAIHDIHTSQG